MTGNSNVRFPVEAAGVVQMYGKADINNIQCHGVLQHLVGPEGALLSSLRQNITVT